MISLVTLIQLFLGLLIPFDAVRVQVRGAGLSLVPHASVATYRASVKPINGPTEVGTVTLSGLARTRKYVLKMPNAKDVVGVQNALSAPSIIFYPGLRLGPPESFSLGSRLWQEGERYPFTSAEHGYQLTGWIERKGRTLRMETFVKLDDQPALKSPTTRTVATYGDDGSLQSVLTELHFGKPGDRPVTLRATRLKSPRSPARRTTSAGGN